MSADLRILLAPLLAIALLAGCQSPPPRKGLSETQITALKAKGFQLTDEGWEFDLSGKVLFDNNSEHVPTNSRQLIGEITRSLLKVGITRVTLEGHTDSYGSSDYNQQLSMRRASAVEAVMMDNGMRQKNIQLRGMGLRQPISNNSSSIGRRENRRVVIIVTN